MPDDQSEQAPAGEPRPEPPPYQPDRELIGYIEKGQKPPTSVPVRPAKKPLARASVSREGRRYRTPGAQGGAQVQHPEVTAMRQYAWS